MAVFAFGMPGIQELVVIAILLLLLCAPLGAVVIVLLVVSRSQRNAPPANANLHPCPDCGKLISHLAESCPNCGRPLNS